jgi:hypothetical protein
MSFQINLYNPALRVKREWISATNLVLGVVVVMIGVGLAYVYFEFEVGRLSAEGRAVDAELAEKQEQFARLTEELARLRRSATIEAELAGRERELIARQEVVEALGAGELGVAEGFSGALRGLARQTIHGLWLTAVEVSAGGGQIALRGRMLNPELLPEYVRKLNQEPVLAGRGFRALEVSLPETPVTPSNGGAAQTALRPRYLEFALTSLELSDKPAGKSGVPVRSGP